jgi:hypothetical protein
MEAAGKRAAEWYLSERDDEERDLIFREHILCVARTVEAYGLEYASVYQSGFLGEISFANRGAISTDQITHLTDIVKDLMKEDHRVKVLIDELRVALLGG